MVVDGSVAADDMETGEMVDQAEFCQAAQGRDGDLKTEDLNTEDQHDAGSCMCFSDEFTIYKHLAPGCPQYIIPTLYLAFRIAL